MKRTLKHVLVGALWALAAVALHSGCDTALDAPLDEVTTATGALVAVVDLEPALRDLAVTTEVEVAIPVTPSSAPAAVQTRKYGEMLFISLFNPADEPPGPCPQPHRVVIRASGPGVDPAEVELTALGGDEATAVLAITGVCETTPCAPTVDLTIVREPGAAGPATLVIER